MRALYSFLLTSIICGAASRSFAADPPTVPAPAKEEVEKVTSEVKSGDSAAITAAVQQIKTWMAGGKIQGEFWTDWTPSLMKAKRYQDVADLAMAGALAKPDIDIITGLFDPRMQALVAMKKYDEALQTAKSYYNVCAMANTDKGVDRVGTMLGKSHPDDLEIIRRFRNGQAAASAATPPAASGNGASDAAASPSSMLKTVQIDPALFKEAIDRWANINDYFGERVNYGNVLLAADRGTDAEKLFRELYQSASTQDELTAATEGVARSMRAEDGNVARANAWLLSLQNAK